MTLEDLERTDKECLTPVDIAPILRVSAYNINLQVRQDKQNGINSFPFPTILIGTRVKIPRRAFIEALRHG